MPCFEPNQSDYWRNENKKKLNEKYREFRHDSDVAEFLCCIISIIGYDNISHNIKNHVEDHILLALEIWWKEHIKRDNKRINNDLKIKVDEFVSSLLENEKRIIKKIDINITTIEK